jgi:hypothetical protein
MLWRLRSIAATLVPACIAKFGAIIFDAIKM